MAKILEESETPDGTRVATVKTDRGEEMLVNVDRAVCALAESLSNIANEKRMGWDIAAPYYHDEFEQIRRQAVRQ